MNHSLATVSLFIFINGLFIAFPALFLPLGQGIGLVTLFSLFYDSGESWNIGTSLIPNLLIFILVYYLRSRIGHKRKSVIKPVTLLINLGLFLYYTILASLRYDLTSQFIFLNLVHLVVSQLVLLIVAGWLISYHNYVLLMFNIDSRANYGTEK
ncbi:MAG: hypothetical protein O3C43_04175 [Verrucomicrobia bacterium]|nr:hypothetical protein [Verrucomicrobiota bacterium]